jgi:hypothetical protein
MYFNDRDIALCLSGRTRQLWAEKYLALPLSADEATWTRWYNFLHDQVEDAHASWGLDIRPSSPEEAYSDEYQYRLRTALHEQVRFIIGAHFVYKNAAVRVPLIVGRTDSPALEIHRSDFIRFWRTRTAM